MIKVIVQGELSVKTGKEIPTQYGLGQNYPNPFNPSTEIEYQSAGTGMVNLSIYDLLGREITVLVNQKQVAGYYSVTWDANSAAGGVASGIYFIHFFVTDEKGKVLYFTAKKMMVVR